MSLLEIIALASVALGLYPLWKMVTDYFSLRRQRSQLERAMLLRRRVTSEHLLRLHNLEMRDKVVRRIIFKDSDLAKIDNVQRAYELLVDLDLSKERSESDAIFNRLKGSLMDQYIETISVSAKPALWNIVNAGLVKAALNSKLTSFGATNVASSSILGIMLGKRMDTYGRAYSFLLAALGLGALIQLTGLSESRLLLGIIAPLFFLAALALNQKLLEYRVNKGYFGSNASEAAEVIQFVKSHSDKSDFSDEDKMKKILPDTKLDEEKELIVYGGGVTA